MMSATHRYQPFFCEENAWWLCQHPAVASDDAAVVFVTNAEKCCLFMEQRAAKPHEPVVWDYHVIVISNAHVWDPDTRLGMPIAAEEYFRRTFLSLPPALQQLTPQFRVVPAAQYVTEFATDRRHMRNETGGWLKPPPKWKAPGAGGHNLMRYVDLADDVGGTVTDLAGLQQRFAT